MSKATTPDEGAIKARARIAVQAELGDDFDEAEFDQVFAEAIQEATTYDEAYNKTIELLKQIEQGEGEGEEDNKTGNKASAEKALRKLADSARGNRKG